MKQNKSQQLILDASTSITITTYKPPFRSSPAPVTQCAAVTTYRLLIKAPPQRYSYGSAKVF